MADATTIGRMSSPRRARLLEIYPREHGQAGGLARTKTGFECQTPKTVVKTLRFDALLGFSNAAAIWVGACPAAQRRTAGAVLGRAVELSPVPLDEP